MEFKEIEQLCADRRLFERVVTRGEASKDEADRIGSAYLYVFKKEIVRACGNCIGDALSQLYSLYKKDKEQMKKQAECKYLLKAGVLIRMQYGDRMYYGNANLTDDIAEAYILADPDRRLGQFQKYPRSIKAKINAMRKAEAEAKEEAAIAEMEEMQGNNDPDEGQVQEEATQDETE